MKKEKMIKICKGSGLIPARFWAYCEVKESDLKQYLDQGYILDWRYKQ